jgi:hypothetical protein
MKIAVNLLLMVEVICFGEAIALAEKGGVARATAVDAVLKSVAASPVLGYRGPFILEGQMPEVPLADVTLQQKDMLLALRTALGAIRPASILQDKVDFRHLEPGQFDFKVELEQPLQLDRQNRLVPSGLRRKLIVGQDVGPLVGIAQM